MEILKNNNVNEILKKAEQNATINKFNAVKFEKSLTNVFLVSNIKDLKNYTKNIKNINEIIKIKFENNAKKLNINGYDFNIFITNAKNFYTNKFDEILKHIDIEKQKQILYKIFIDFSKTTTAKNDNNKLERVYKNPSALVLIKKFIIEVCVFYANLEA